MNANSATQVETDQTEAHYRAEANTLPNFPFPSLSILTASLAINVFSLALPVVILQIYDRVLPNASINTMAFFILGLGIVLFIDGLFQFTRNYLSNWQAMQYEHLSGCRAVKRMLACDIRSFEKNAPGDHMDRFNALEIIRDFHAGQSKTLIIDLAFASLFLAVIYVIAGTLVYTILAILGILIIFAGFVGLILKKHIKQKSKHDDYRFNFIIEVLTHIHTVKSLAMETLMLRRYERLQENGAASTYLVTFWSNIAQTLGLIFSLLIMVAVAAIGSTHVIAGNLSMGALAASTLLAGRTAQPLLRALGIWTQFQTIKVAQNSLRELFALNEESNRERKEVPPLKGRLELKNISFAYDKKTSLLTDISLNVEVSQFIGISGGTGSGKSTLLQLVLGALSPTSGSVLYDGLDSTDFAPQGIRNQIAYLSQQPVLFRGTILENITLFHKKSSVDDAIKATQLLGIDKPINRLPLGYDTLVANGTSEDISVGLKQGIAMARALSKGSKIILFDEANSALDNQSDEKLRQMMERLKGLATIILISQRPSLLNLADCQFNLINGALKEKEMTNTSVADKAVDKPNIPPIAAG
ncbi:peptidase domain-containing ABC transporter [Kiloniella sp. EL199]|uniref:peptidase domain-containing ABC transporter n=1 Tax=Kiloniella sp. EL199 TaxID=2107581 RepID=UPI000EA291E2|nr:ABC transporter transmembrane domain-containing protein [Kiloniella sp. EL199]